MISRPGMWVLVTASRDTPDPHAINRRLLDCYEYAVTNGLGWLNIMHGDASGGDKIADTWTTRANRNGWRVHPPHRRPANWRDPCHDNDPRCREGHRRHNADGSDICPVAGFYRNEAMVAEAAEKAEQGITVVVLAFIHNNSNGASQCANVAQAAGLDPIIIRTYTPDFPESKMEYPCTVINILPTSRRMETQYLTESPIRGRHSKT